MGIYASSVHRRDLRRLRRRRRVGLLLPVAMLGAYAVGAAAAGVIAIAVVSLLG